VSAPSPQGRVVKDAHGNTILTTAATGLTLDQLVGKMVQADSMSWMANKYIPDSVHNARYLSANKARTTYVAYGEYGYSGFFGGGTGWVKIHVTGGQVSCFEFWDQPGNCRLPWHSLSQQTIVSAAASAMTSGGGGTPSTDSLRRKSDEDFEMSQRVNQQIQNQADCGTSTGC
jgi:hypothetical protein